MKYFVITCQLNIEAYFINKNDFILYLILEIFDLEAYTG